MDNSLEGGIFSDESLEERFIRSNLSFLIEPDDDFAEQIIHYISHEEVCIYGTSTIDSRVTESWSVLSIGSLISPREKPSKFSSLYTPLTSSATPGEPPIPEIPDPLDLSLIIDVLQGHTSTPVKHYVTDGNVHRVNVPLDLSYIPSNPQRPSDPLDLSGNAVDFSCIMQEPLDLTSHHLDLIMHDAVRGNRSTPVKSYNKRELPLLDLTCDSLELSYTLRDDNRDGTPNFSCKDEKSLDLSYNSLDLPSVKNWVINNSMDLSNDSFPRHLKSKNVETQTEDASALATEIELPSLKMLPGTRPTRNVRDPPIKKLNMISKLNKIEDVPQQNETIVSGCVKVKEEESSNEIASEVKLQSLTLADFMQKPVAEDKPVVEPPKPNKENKENNFCKFCFKNGELSKIYTNHVTKGPDGNVVCPILRKYVCNFCGATGDIAHTRNYCPLNSNRNTRKPFFRRLSNGILTTCHNHK